MMRRKRALFTAIESLEIRRLLSSYLVNTTSDAADPGIGLLSLREAVDAANADTTPDTISFDPAVFTAGSLHTITLENGPILFMNTTAAINLNGPGSAVVAVDGNHISRVFQISSGVTVSISGLTITDGSVNSSAGVPATGAGIQNAGVLTLSSVTVSKNSVTGESDQNTPADAGNSAYGAGIYSTGALTLTSSSVSGNNATGGSSQYRYVGNACGGGIYSTGSLTITGSSILGNNAMGGGGNSEEGLTDEGNAGYAFGGGIFSSGQTALNSSYISSNVATGGDDDSGGASDGGGIYLAGAATFSDDTLSKNQAVGGYNPSTYTGPSGNAAGGAVYSIDALSIISSTLTGNTATGGAGPSQDYGPAGNASGGAIAAENNLTISNSTISANLAAGGAGDDGYNYPDPNVGAQASGGGIYAAQQLMVTNCTVSLNTAQGANGGRVDADSGGPGQGGGITTLGTGIISETQITDNVASGGVGTNNYANIDSPVIDSGDGDGGGVYNSGVLTIVNSTLSGNQATGGVGAVPAIFYDGNQFAGTGGDGLGAGIFSTSTLTVENSTIAANIASGGNGGDANDGGATFNGGNGGNGEGGGIYCAPLFMLYDSTIVQNTAMAGAAGELFSEPGYSGVNGTSGVAEGGGIYAGKNTLLDNSILSANNAASGADVYSSLSATSAYNLIGYGAPLTNGVNGNQIGINDPMLSALADNGGPTQTMLPLAGSPVIDAGSNALIPAGVETDQRGEGYPRIVNGTVDIGAVEYVSPVTATPSITVTPAADQSVVVGQDHSFSLGTFAESNATGPFSATVDWGDGSTDTVISFITAAGNIPAQSHTFASIGNDTVTVSVTDSAGDASSPGSFAVTVNPAAVSSTPVGSTPVGSTPVITSTTSLTASPVLSASGTQVRLTCSVTGGSSTPTGTVTFSLNGSAIGTDDLSSGFATLTTDVLAAGSDAFTASYGGDTNYSPSSSAAVSVVIPSPSPVSVALSKAVVPSTNVAGEKFNAKLPLVLTNSAATVKGVFTINYYVNSVARINGAKTLIGSVTKRLTIKAGKSVVVTNAIKALPASLPAGSYYLLAEMTDPSGSVNVAATAGTVTVAAPVVRLAATVGSVMPQTILIGRSGLIAVTITNNGNIAAIGKLVISVNPSTDGSTALPIVLAVYDVKTSILAGKTKTIKLRMKVSTTLGAGSYLPVASIGLDAMQLTVAGTSGFTVG